MTYLILKNVHVAAALATISGFLLRGYWMMTESENLHHRAVRILPHFVDTTFFLAGVGMLWQLHLNPLTQPWLIAKFAGLVAYILLGTVAIKRGSTRQVRMVALVGALAAFAYIVGVALAKSPSSWLAL